MRLSEIVKASLTERTAAAAEIKCQGCKAEIESGLKWLCKKCREEIKAYLGEDFIDVNGPQFFTKVMNRLPFYRIPPTSY